VPVKFIIIKSDPNQVTGTHSQAKTLFPYNAIQ